MNLFLLLLIACMAFVCAQTSYIEAVVSYNETVCEELHQQKVWVEEVLLSNKIDEDVYEELNTLRKTVSQQIAQMCRSKVF
jgi:hypothetical protein